MSRKIQRSVWRDGGHRFRKSPRISALDAWKYSEEEEEEEDHHHQRPPSGAKRKLHERSTERQNHEGLSTNSKEPLVAKGKESTKFDDHATSAGQSSAISPVSFMPEKRILELVVDILQRRDTYEIFGEPVDPKEVEDYYEIIEEPMDFGTMRAKLHEGLYKTLEQFEHDAFLIPRNAMHFNSTATIYFRQARATYELAKKVFHVLKTAPEKLELEFPVTRRRSCRRPKGGGKSLNFNSCRRVTTNFRTKSSSSGPSNLGKSIWGNPGFTSTSNKRDNDFSPGVRDGRRSNIVEADRRSMYRPLMSFQNENDSIVSTVCSEPKLLAQANQRDISYQESLMLFAKDLGPTAQMIANRKLKGWSKDSPIFLAPPSNSRDQTSTCPFPAAFVSAQKGPATLDTPITNPSHEFFDSLHERCSELETTPDIIDLTSVDDGEKANTNNAIMGHCATNKKRARMGNHSALMCKVATNNTGDTCNQSSLLGKVGFNIEDSTRLKCDWMKSFSISDSDNKIHEKEINKIHQSLFTSTSGAEEFSSSTTGIHDASKKSIALTLDSGKMDDLKQQATLASYHSHSSESEFKLINSTSSTTYSWPWHRGGDSEHEPLAAVKHKGGTDSSSSYQASYSVESNQLMPLASPFAFDLPFLKSRLSQMNSQNGFLQPKFQQVTDKGGQSSGQMSNKNTSECTRKAVLSTQPSQLASYNQHCSVWDTNLALRL
ncbi:uncharacterized protein LOC131326196 [Rhododendron vialii]|uniref:uncharacterized protein LOC131326196 n=1 Tax=Rhododendron vialii TaxID=182163 RepID=UPI0026602A8F|nr:uncharacterized protein LOC131326196 [Rhododendron vialii]